MPWREREARAREHEPGVTRRDRDREAGGHERPSAGGLEGHVVARVEVEAGVVGVLLAGQRQIRIEARHADLHDATP